jgi:hypothetical protein
MNLGGCRGVQLNLNTYITATGTWWEEENDTGWAGDRRNGKSQRSDVG